MATNAQIKACLGVDAARYAANKHRGGSSGNKGTRYEDFFMAFKVAEAAARWMVGESNPHVKGQDEGFVDDLRLGSDDGTAYFQMKNQEAVSWTAGEHPIATDFQYQHKLSVFMNEPAPSTNLVVPAATLANTLGESIPVDIKSHSAVVHFPWTRTANKLVLELPALREHLAVLSHVEKPTDDALTGTFGALLMACIEFPDGATVSQLLGKAAGLFPGQIRLLPDDQDWERHFDLRFRQVLDRIEGLMYGASRGFFQWTAFGTSGVFAQSVLSEEFALFQNQIVKLQPKTFEAFEEALP
ncbi:hypothetical protein [Dyella sp.]|uniref:hypothetical protein n=1 Tax=Dyella sp. TaxID=1869338 RepID=UPI002ED14E1F